MSKACIDRSDSLISQHKRRPRVIGFTYASSEVHFRSTESQTFYWSIMTADDSIKCRCANSGMTGQVGGFQNPGVCLQAFPSFLPHPLPALLLAPLFSRSLTLVPRSFLLNCTETLTTQANFFQTCLDIRQPGTVFIKLDARQSEILTNFLEIARLRWLVWIFWG